MVSTATALIVVFTAAVLAFTVWIFRLSLDDAHTPWALSEKADEDDG